MDSVTVAIVAALGAISLAGNIWLAISWRKATAKALLADGYAKLLVSTAKREKTAMGVIVEKENRIRELEKSLLEHVSVPELVDELNRLFAETDSDRETDELPTTKRVPKPSKN